LSSDVDEAGQQRVSLLDNDGMSRHRQQGLEMTRTYIASVAIAVFLAMTLASCGKQEEGKVEKAAAEGKKKAVAEVKTLETTAQEKEAQETAIDVYIYAYPLVTMEITRRVSTNLERPERSYAPMGQFARLRNYPAADDHTLRAPNADTLYIGVWLDVSREPWIVSIPDMKGRYFVFPMLDAWTNVFQDPGKRTTGTKAQKYAISGPGWKGTLPAGVAEYKSPTGMVWVAGQIYCTGTLEDYKAVQALQDQVSVIPLSSFGKPYKPRPGTVDPAIDMKASPRGQVNAMDGASYFKLFAELLKTNPPAPDDAPMVAKLAKIGIVPGQDFDASKLDPAVADAIAAAPKPALEKIKSWMKQSVVAGGAKVDNAWLHWTTVGRYGTEYRQRAMVTYYGLGANLPQDEVGAISEGSDNLKWYSAEHNYEMHFNKGELPPVDGFWSLTMYDANYFFVPNVLDRYTLSGRNKFKTNGDGSVDLYIQHDSPGRDREANWLPAPPDTFVLMLRLYWPKKKPPSFLDGTWKVPEAQQVQ
jgi:hypothetical protein